LVISISPFLVLSEGKRWASIDRTRISGN
jgi:hypothetical protein